MGTMPTLRSTRWALAGLLALLSAIAVMATWSKDTESYPYGPDIATDIREPGLIFGSAGLGGLMIMRSAGVFLPKPWRPYVDRLEFAFVTMLWILWTSATMAFSASTISKTICLQHSNTGMPKCSVLTSDLLLLHGLSLASFAYLLTVLSTALSPGYLASLSPSLSDLDGMNSDGVGGEAGGIFLMWDLALGGSPKVSPADLPDGYQARGETVYGTAPPAVAASRVTSTTTEPSSETVNGNRKPDRFANGRVGMYVPLLFTSLAVVFCISAVSTRGFPGLMAMVVLSLAILSIAFTASSLLFHHRQRSEAVQTESSRAYRAVELGTILALFVLWPIAATLYTLSPSSSDRPCTSPAGPGSGSGDTDEEVPGDAIPADKWLSICNLTLLTLSLAWFCSWISLARAVSLVFPMPDSASDKPTIAVPILGHSRGLSAGRGEGQPLLSPSTATGSRKGVPQELPVERPQVKYGRLVAGEAFELGDDDEE